MPTTLRLQFEGVSLWMDRGTHIDVLFPDATLANLDAHTVTTETKGTKAIIDRTVLDFRATFDVIGGQSANLPASGLLRVDVPEDAPAAQRDAAFDTRHTLAAVRLPMGGVTSLRGDIDGPFEYDGRANVRVGYGALWDCMIAKPTSPIVAEVFDQETATLRERRDFGTALTNPLKPLIVFKSLSQWDRDNPYHEIEPDEVVEDFDAVGVLSRGKNSPPLPTLTFRGGTGQSHATSGPSAAASTLVLVNVYRPCPPGYGNPGW
jgi:hypothetical protein